MKEAKLENPVKSDGVIKYTVIITDKSNSKTVRIYAENVVDLMSRLKKDYKVGNGSSCRVRI